ncbi:hypothetical protein NQ318_000652 [Aromia moschata]|uniref:Uncharacterized protein n=1 Tax=Aromia moschata TaxID=1265417 RepID=A0AAV8XMG8_9CUCU|nr:hypothetical protein NQ318_000652 [Aromia moschata]
MTRVFFCRTIRTMRSARGADQTGGTPVAADGGTTPKEWLLRDSDHSSSGPSKSRNDPLNIHIVQNDTGEGFLGSLITILMSEFQNLRLRIQYGHHPESNFKFFDYFAANFVNQGFSGSPITMPMCPRSQEAVEYLEK